MRTLVAVVLAAAFLAAPAAADWDRTRWGLSPDQVTYLYPAAADLPAAPGDGRTYRVLKLAGPLSYDGRTWTEASFHFERGGRLTRVELSAAPGQVEAIEAWLTGRFGPPLEREGHPPRAGDTAAYYTVRHRDAASGDEVKLGAGVLANLTVTLVTFSTPDPAARLRASEARRLFELRQRGLAPLPPGGWNNTRWAMSREQVLALWPSARPDELNRLVVNTDFNFQGRTWRQVAFSFDPDYGLSKVSVWSQDSEFEALEQHVRALYGPPREVAGARPGSIPGNTIYGAFFSVPGTGETAMLFATRVNGLGGTGIALEPGPDPAPPAPPTAAATAALAWRMTLPQFKTVYPGAAQVMEGSDYWQVLSPTLHGFTWKRGLFGFKYGTLWEYTLFSTDSFETIHAAFTARFGPAPRVARNGAFTDYWFDDVRGGDTLRLRANRDGTATLSASRFYG
jgi:hypothetical protein